MRYVLYHGLAKGSTAQPGCPDGFGAAYAAWKKFGDEGTEYIPVAYGLPFPEDVVDGSEIYIVDFSFSREILLNLADVNERVIVYDHHKTAREALMGLEHPNLGIVFDMERSGALITWEELHGKDKVPFFPRSLSDRDLWQFKLHGTKEIHTLLLSYPFDFKVWDILCSRLEDPTSRETAIAEGASILRFRDCQVDDICLQQERISFGGHDDIPAVNATSAWSEVGHKLLELNPDRPFVVVWYRRGDGEIQISLRSRKDFDCSAVAKLYGGGGHFSASGCMLSWDDWAIRLE